MPERLPEAAGREESVGRSWGVWSCTSGGRHAGADVEKWKWTDPPPRGAPRGCNADMDQVAGACINPLPSLADRDRSGRLTREPEENSAGKSNRAPRTLGRRCHQLSDKSPPQSLPPPHTHTHDGAREGATGQPRSGSSGIVMHESPARRASAMGSAQPEPPRHQAPPAGTTTLAHARPALSDSRREGAAGGSGLSLPAWGWLLAP